MTEIKNTDQEMKHTAQEKPSNFKKLILFTLLFGLAFFAIYNYGSSIVETLGLSSYIGKIFDNPNSMDEEERELGILDPNAETIDDLAPTEKNNTAKEKVEEMPENLEIIIPPSLDSNDDGKNYSIKMPLSNNYSSNENQANNQQQIKIPEPMKTDAASTQETSTSQGASSQETIRVHP